MAQKIFDNLEPGGYFELQDPCLPAVSDDGSMDGTALGEYVHGLFACHWSPDTAKISTTESTDIRGRIELANMNVRWNRLLVEAMARIGRDLTASQMLDQNMSEVGFEDVT
jgi:hypothetical protein